MRQKIDWLNHSLEFLVVIIGILIAFQLNKCSMENTQQKLVQDRSVYTSKPFINALGSYRYWMNARIQKYQECIEVIEKFSI